MRKTYCDKCKKIVKNDEECSIHIYGNNKIFEEGIAYTHLCEKCTLQFSKVWKRFLGSQKNK